MPSLSVQFLPSCIPAFLISSWVAGNPKCAADGIQVLRPGAPGSSAMQVTQRGLQP
jgi:hypothetical protein